MSVARLHVIEAPAARMDEQAGTRRRVAIPLPQTATLSEIFAGDGSDGAATGFALAGIAPGTAVLWVQDRLVIRDAGRIHPQGIGACELIHVEAPNAKAALWAMEEGLRCLALGAVIGELWGNPRALDFTATRRLAVAAEKHGVPATLILFSAEPNLSGARMRWRVESRPSPKHPWDEQAPGAPAWSLDLFKARGSPSGRWEVAHEADGLGVLSSLGDGRVAASASGRHAA